MNYAKKHGDEGQAVFFDLDAALIIQWRTFQSFGFILQQMNVPIKIHSNKPATIKEYWAEMLKHKSYIRVFAQQEIVAQYTQTYFGLVWVFAKPLVTLTVFTIIFRYFLKVPTQSPYYLFAFTGMIGWNLFSQIAFNAGSAIQQKQTVIRKMYFPKLLLPLSKVLVAMVETAISLLILFVLIIFENIPLGWHMLALPLFLLLNIFCGLAVAVWLNALNIYFRDLNQLVPTIMGVGVWLTPVFYPVTIIPAGYEFFLYLNPLACIIGGYRYALLNEAFPGTAYWGTMAVVIAILVLGIKYFINKESEMVDYS